MNEFNKSIRVNDLALVWFYATYMYSILGSALIVCGLYMVLWGKKKESETKSQPVPSHVSQSQVIDKVVTPPTIDDKSVHTNINFTTYIAKDHQDSPRSIPE